MLQVGAEPFGLQCRPDRKLVHGVRLRRPAREALCVDGELVLHGLHGAAGLEEQDLGWGLVGAVGKVGWDGGTYSSVCGLESVQALLSALPLLIRNDASQRLLRKLPQRIMFLLDQQEHTGGLGVEGRGDVKHDLLDDILDLFIRDGGFLLQRIDRATGGDLVEEGLGFGGHVGVGGRELFGVR